MFLHYIFVKNEPSITLKTGRIWTHSQCMEVKISHNTSIQLGSLKVKQIPEQK